ncbi:ABC transporter substrate-binding protein [Deinococcus rubellus]|uniref:ABC transporter substrate-binding protein n=1 Tax=Deinococcus rubellus TaxID=1889240 RepID=UPI0031F08DB1
MNKSVVLSFLLGLGSLTALSVQSLAGAERVLRHDEAAPGQLDPAKATDYASSILMFNVYDALVQPDAAKGVAPSLATSWKITPDGKTYTFTLRNDVKFHDNSKLTSADVLFSYQRIKAINQGFANLFDTVTGVKSTSPTTVVFTLSEPYAPFISNLSRLQIVNKALTLKNKQTGKFGANGDYGQAYLSTHDAGSGAYAIESHDGQSLTVMKKFGGYFQPFVADAPDTVRQRYGLDPTTARTLMQRKELDITSQWLPPETLKALASNGMSLVQEIGSGNFFVKLNTQKAPTDDLNVRKAIAAAFDYATLRSLLKITDTVASGSPANGPLVPGMPGYNKAIPAPNRNLELAKSLLAKSKYKGDQLTIEVGWVAEVPFEERIALLMQQNLAEVGIKVNVTKVPWAVMTQRAAKATTTPNASLVYVSPIVPDPDAMLYPVYHSSSAGTWLSMEWLKDTQVDKLLDQARTETNPSKRAEIYQQASKRIVDLQPDIFGYVQNAVFAKQSNVSIPALQDPTKTVAMQGGNFIFRTISVK